MVKKIVPWLIILSAFFFLFFQREILVAKVNYLFQSSCETPLAYRIGRVDPEYQKTREVFLEQVKQAEDLWGQAYGQDLFIYDPRGDLAVNLIYTERQSALDELEDLQSGLASGKESLNQMVAEYEGLARDFEDRLAAFNRKVNDWNNQGGAPSPIFEQLLEEQTSLQAEADRLNALAEKLNLTVKNYNVQVGGYNKSVQAYNLAVQQRPEAGLYDGFVSKIDIYLTLSEAELIHTLAHEFGHALGLEHFDNPQAIMYPFSSEAMTPVPAEIESLQAICETRNYQRLFQDFGEQLGEMIESWQKN